jgi:hypothetical protein
MDMRFGTWNIRSLYEVGSLMTVLRELSKYKLDLVGVQDYMRTMAQNQQGNTHFSTERGMRVMSWIQVFLSIREAYL